ncbi:hypothetical protein [Sphingobium sp. TCM1]|uniref:hypothetical protein n=1 Tax=Sphingobium sp. TCM1 TaxID=453246 RepID=UPI000A89DA69|nr:hypothetical protein [Sphingobium sp. TCM1]
MGKIVKIVAVVALAAVAMVAFSYLAPALFTAFGGTVAAGATASSALAAAGASAAAIAAKVLAGVIVGLGMSLASRMIMGKPKTFGSAISYNITTDPTATRKIVFGRTAAGTDERFHEKISRNSWDYLTDLIQNNPLSAFRNQTPYVKSLKKGDYLHRVIALASHKVHNVEYVYLEDELSYTNGTTTGTYRGNSGLVIGAVEEGSATNAEQFGSGAYWTPSASFTGCAYLKLIFRLSTDNYPDGLPTRITTIVDGCPVYDPRLDSTANGVGSHRANNQDSWSFVDGAKQIGRNPALALLTYLIGWRINGRLAWGMGVPVDRIDLGSFIAYANMCEEPVVSSNGTVQRYLCDCLLTTADTHETNINIITSAMGTAKLVDTAGLYQLIGGYDDLDGPTITFTHDDLIGQYTYTPDNLSLKDTFNIARGRFPDPENLYQLNDWGQIEIAPLPDNIPRPVVLDFAGVTRFEQAQRIAKQNLVRNRYTATFSAIFGPKAFMVQVGSLVKMVIPELGWNGKLFRVISQSETIELAFNMTLQEEHAQVYAWDDDETKPLPPVVRVPAYNPNDSIPVADLQSSTRTILNSNGGQVSQIDVTWEAPDAGVQCIQIEYREQSSDIWQTATDRFSHEAEAFSFTANAGGVNHIIRARYLMFSGMWGSWTTTQVLSAADSNYSAVVGYLTNESVAFPTDAAGNIT